MADQLPAVDPVAEFFGTVISAAVAGGEAAAEAAIGAAIPFLEAPGMNLLTNWLVGKIGAAIQVNIANLVTSIVIDVQTSGEASAVFQAAQALQAAQASGNQAAIAAAIQGAINAYAGLAHSDGTYTPST